MRGRDDALFRRALHRPRRARPSRGAGGRPGAGGGGGCRLSSRAHHRRSMAPRVPRPLGRCGPERAGACRPALPGGGRLGAGHAGAAEPALGPRPPGHARHRRSTRPSSVAAHRARRRGCDRTASGGDRKGGGEGDPARHRLSHSPQASATWASASAPTPSTSAGSEVESYVAEGAFELDERAARPLFVPAWGFRPRDDATYFPMPWLLSTRRLRRAGRQHRDEPVPTSATGSPRAWSVEVDGVRAAPARVRRARARPTVLRRLTERIGRQPRPPAPFVLRPLVPAHATTRRADPRAPAARATFPSRWRRPTPTTCPASDQRGREAAERERVRRFHAAGLAVTTYFNPMICTDLHAALRRGGGRGCAERATRSGEPYVYRYSTRDELRRRASSTSPRAPGAAALRAPAGRGDRATATTAGWRTSASTRRSTRAPPTASTGSALHNLYPRQYHCAAYDVARRRRGRSRASSARAGPASAPLLAGRVGRRPDDGLGLRRPRARRSPTG